jgi:cell division protein FtsN
MATKNRHMFELRLGKLGLILFVCGMSVLLFSMFLLGIVVGKHMDAFPERFSPGIADMIRSAFTSSAPEARKVKPSTEAAKTDLPAEGEENFDLTFYDTLGGKRGRAQAAKAADAIKAQPSEASEPVTASTGEMVLPKPFPKASGGAVGDAVPPVSGIDVKKKEPLTGKKTAVESPSGIPETASTKKASEAGNAAVKGYYEIQVAAHQDQKKAERMAEKLKPLGFAPRVVEKDLPGKGKWYRVIVAGFETKAKAKEAADRIDGKIRGVKCAIRSSGKE